MLTKDLGALLKKAKTTLKDVDIVVDPYDLTFIWVSDKLCRLSGFEQDKLVGQQIFALDIRGQPATKEIELMMMRADENNVIEVPVKTKDGKDIIVKIQAISITFKDQPYMVARIV